MSSRNTLLQTLTCLLMAALLLVQAYGTSFSHKNTRPGLIEYSYRMSYNYKALNGSSGFGNLAFSACGKRFQESNFAVVIPLIVGELANFGLAVSPRSIVPLGLIPLDETPVKECRKKEVPDSQNPDFTTRES